MQPPGLHIYALQSITENPCFCRDEVTWVWAWRRLMGAVAVARLRGYGKVQYELAFVLVQPYLSLRVGAAGELVGLAVVKRPPPELIWTSRIPGRCPATRAPIGTPSSMGLTGV